MKRVCRWIAVVTIAAFATVGTVNAATNQGLLDFFRSNNSFLEISRSLITRGLRVIGNTSFQGSLSSPGSMPVTIGDDLRVDGDIYRGATVGKNDGKPLKINDDLKVAGNIETTGTLTASGGLNYNNATSGLSATTVQSAIDEVGVKLSKLVSGTALASAAGGSRVASLSATTWKGYIYDVCHDNTGTYGFHTSNEVTITFTPTSETAGTYSTSPYDVFHPDEVCGYGTGGTTTGIYHIVENVIMVVPNDGSVGLTNSIAVRGNTMTLIDTRISPNIVTVLTRQ